MAPELFSLSVDKAEPSYGKSVDIYSLGVSSLAVLDAQEGSPVLAITGELYSALYYACCNEKTNCESNPGIYCLNATEKLSQT